MISNVRCHVFVRAVSLAAVLWLLGSAEAQAGESGATLTPDKAAYLVNKDLGSDRWTIGLNVLPGDANRSINVTGNVFHSDGGPPSFVVCQVNADSSGTLTDPSSGFSFTCRGSGPCATTATECGGTDAWPLISDNVPISAAFFLPSGGLGNLASAAADRRGAACGSLACLAQRLVDAMAAAGSRLLAAVRTVTLPTQADAQSNDRGATLSFDGFAYLVNKDIGNERWSIALNVAPVETAQGTVSRIQSVTGNVFKRDGSAPSFVFCTERPDSQGTLDDPSSQFRVSCSGTAACATTAAECAVRSAARAWPRASAAARRCVARSSTSPVSAAAAGSTRWRRVSPAATAHRGRAVPAVTSRSDSSWRVASACPSLRTPVRVAATRSAPVSSRP
jgi:hypothetical protein